MIGYPRLVRSAVLRSLARILLPSVDGRPSRMGTGRASATRMYQTTRVTTYLLRGAAAMDRAFRNFRNGDAHFGPHPWPAPYIPNWAPIFYLNTTRQPPRMRPEKASAMPASDRRVSTRAETTSRFRGRQDSGRVEIVNYTLTAASQSLSATWIATCGAVQASWFVV
jgi:hypothetical protein